MSTGISQGTAAFAAKVALRDAVRVALTGDTKVDVVLGSRWPIVARDYVAVLGGRVDVDPSTIVPGRSYQETITLDLEVGSFTPLRGDQGEQAAQARAFDLLTKVHEHIRRNDITLGGLVHWAVPGDTEWDGATADENAGWGRLCIIASTFRCLHTIRNV